MAPTVSMTNVLRRAERRKELRAQPRPRFSPGDLANIAAMYPTDNCPALSFVVLPPHPAAIRAVLMLGSVIDVRCYHRQMRPP